MPRRTRAPTPMRFGILVAPDIAFRQVTPRGLLWFDESEAFVGAVRDFADGFDSCRAELHHAEVLGGRILTTSRTRYSSTDRNALAMAALEWCRAAREHDGVNDSRFYWIDPNEIVVVTDAEPGAWGNGSGAELSPRAAKAVFALADLARSTSTETWADARSGAEMFDRAQ